MPDSKQTSNEKYAAHAGFVFSKHDGDKHFIRGEEVARLYGVNPDECIIVDALTHRGVREYAEENLINLKPRNDGNYNLEEL